MIYIEVIQSVGISFKDYVSMYSNYYDVYTYSCSLILVVVQLLELDWPPPHV